MSNLKCLSVCLPKDMFYDYFKFYRINIKEVYFALYPLSPICIFLSLASFVSIEKGGRPVSKGQYRRRIVNRQADRKQDSVE